jgi:hypothetical protein
MIWSFETHRNEVKLLPVCTHIELRCGNPSCGQPHGWVLEIGWLFWSLVIESHGPSL